MKPIMNSSPAWMTAATDIRDLADCLAAYRQHLLTQNETVKKNQNLNHPVRTVAKDATIEHREPCITNTLRDKYVMLDKVVNESNSVLFSIQS